MAECLDHNIRSLHYSLLRLWVCSTLGRYWIRCAIVSAMLSTCLCLSSRFSLDVYCDASTWFYTTVYIYLFIILHLKATTFHPYYVNHFIVIDFVLVGKAIQIWLFIPLNIVEWVLMMTIYQTLGHFVETLNIRIFVCFVKESFWCGVIRNQPQEIHCFYQRWDLAVGTPNRSR